MSSIDKNMETMVLNYSKSPIAITTRDSQYLIPGSTDGVPAEFPLTVSEIVYINSVSDIFKCGYLWFDRSLEEELYGALRITDWRTIMRDEQIDDIILHPTSDKLREVIDIQRPRYFERIYGRYIGLKNAGYPISGSVEKIMSLRRKEFADGKVTSEIQVSVAAPVEAHQEETNRQLEEMKKQLAELQALLAAKESAGGEAEKPATKPKSTAKKTTAKSTGTKTKET